jgi:hypothetical protein
MTARCAACGEPLALRRGEDLGGGVETMFYWCPRCNAPRDRGDQMTLEPPVAPARRPLLRLPPGRGTRKVGSRGRGP